MDSDLEGFYFDTDYSLSTLPDRLTAGHVTKERREDIKQLLLEKGGVIRRRDRYT